MVSGEIMNNVKISEIANKMAKLVEVFVDAGIPLYLVGGSVRDALLDVIRPSNIPEAGQEELDHSIDFDFTTPALPDVVETLIKPLASDIWLVGKRFGTVSAIIDGVRVEITTHRGEKYALDSRNPSVVMPTTLYEDLSRRDFTINAIGLDLTDPQAELVDPFGGMADLKAGILRTPVAPGTSFEDDPLRMMRAARFAAKLGFSIANDVVDAIVAMAKRIEIVSAERVRDELNKILLSPKPSIGLRVLVDTGLADLFLPELPLLKLEQDPIHHHKDVLEHTYSVVDQTAPDLELRLAALFHDVGKPATRKIDAFGVSFHNHDKVGAKMTRRRMRELRYSQSQIDTVSRLVYMHLRFHTYQAGWTDKAVRRYVVESGPLLERLNALTLADCTTRNQNKVAALASRMADLELRILDLREREELDSIRAELNGEQIMATLGIGPSKDVGRALDYLLEIRMEDGLLGHDQVVARLLNWWTTRTV